MCKGCVEVCRRCARGVGRCGKVRGGAWRCVEMCGDAWRCEKCVRGVQRCVKVCEGVWRVCGRCAAHLHSYCVLIRHETQTHMSISSFFHVSTFHTYEKGV